MASTVEQCENKTITPLSATLDLFDTFKNSQEDDKDSDEESFHLPLLGCDDDAENGKEGQSGKNTPSGETEDDILNKFEVAAPEDLDPKLEDEILNECENGSTNYGNDNKDFQDSNIADKAKFSNDIEENSDKCNSINDEGMFSDLEIVDETHEENRIDQKNSSSDVLNHETPCEEMEIEAVEVNKVQNEEQNPTSENLPSDEIVHNEVVSEHTEENQLVKQDEKETDLGVSEDDAALVDDPMVSDNNEDLIQSSQHEQNDEVLVNNVSDKEALEEDSLRNTAIKDAPNDIQLHEDITSVQEQLFNNENETTNEATNLPNTELKKQDEFENLEQNLTEESTEELMETENLEESAKDSKEINTDVLTVEKAPIVDEQNEEPKTPEDETTESVDLTDENKETNEILDDNKEVSELENEYKEPVGLDENKKSIISGDKLETIELDQEKEPTQLDDTKEIPELNEESKKEILEEKGMDETESVNIIETDEDQVVNESVDDKSVTKLDAEDGNKETMEELKTDNNESIKMLDSDDSSNKTDENTKDQTESSEKPFECEDLLDISVICDADEDNANALADITESEARSSEKSDTDDEEEKKEEAENDDIETEQDETQMSAEREEPMEFDQDTNSCDPDNSTTDNIISENTSDSENKENEPVHSDTNGQPSLVGNVIDTDSNQSCVEIEKNQEVPEVSPLELDDSTKPTESSATQPEEVAIKPVPSTIDQVIESVVNKRPLSEGDNEVAVTKKMRLDEKVEKSKKSEMKTGSNDKVKTLLTFEHYMKKRNLGEEKLTRSDLEQFCLQKICEAIMHKTDVGELHQTIKKQENIIDGLRKDILQLSKQARDLDIVNKKLMNELRAQNGNQKPLVPLKITRSVGLQVKLNVGTEPVTRRKSYTSNTPRTPITPNNIVTNRNRNVPQGNVVRQVAPATSPANSPRKSPAQAPILTQALQTRPTPVAQTPTPPNKRPAPARPKNAEPVKQAKQVKTSAPGVIDLTDEDDRTAKTLTNNIPQKNVGNKTISTPVKILNKNLNMTQNKNAGAKVNNVSPKVLGKPGVQAKGGMQARAMAGLPQGVRLTAAQMKNGITIPANVVTTNAQGTTQLMYVVQPGSLVNSTAGGTQKAVLLNFQPTNGVLTSTLNGSTVSVIPSKTTNSMQLKSLTPRKHPAPLPLPPPAIINSSLKKLLPKPHLSIRKTETGIILQWRMPYNLDDYEGIASYQLFAYQETNAPPSTDMWRKVGDVKALALPMACTLTQFADKNKYYFAVRSVDVHKRIGAFSDPEEISL